MAEQGRNTEDGKNPVSDIDGRNLLRLGEAGDVYGIIFIESNILKGAALVAINKIR